MYSFCTKSHFSRISNFPTQKRNILIIFSLSKMSSVGQIYEGPGSNTLGFVGLCSLFIEANQIPMFLHQESSHRWPVKKWKGLYKQTTLFIK